MCLDNTVRCIWMGLRFKGGKWADVIKKQSMRKPLFPSGSRGCFLWRSGSLSGLSVGFDVLLFPAAEAVVADTGNQAQHQPMGAANQMPMAPKMEESTMDRLILEASSTMLEMNVGLM